MNKTIRSLFFVNAKTVVLVGLLAVVVAVTFGLKVNAAEAGWWDVNDVERAYVNSGWDAGVWLSSPGTSYHDSTVVAPYGAVWVSVEIRGSWYTRGRGVDETRTHNLSTGDWRLQNIQGADFSRGVASNPWGSNVFVYNPGGKKTAELYVEGLCKGRAGQSVTTTVRLWNEFKYHNWSGWHVGQGSWDDSKIVVKCEKRPWSISGQSWVTKSYNPNDTNNYGTGWVESTQGGITALPGETVDWWHSLYITEPMDAGQSVITGVQQDVFHVGTSNRIIGGPEGSWHSYYGQNLFGRAIPVGDWKTYRWNRDYNYTDYQNNWLETIHNKRTLEEVKGELRDKKFMYTRKIRHEDVGKRICQRAYWDKPSANSSTQWTYTQYSCVDIPYVYDLKPLRPSTAISGNTIIDFQAVTGIKANVNNSGPTKSDKRNKKYAVVRYVISSSENDPTGGDGVTRAVNSTNEACRVVEAALGGVRDCAGLHFFSDSDQISHNGSRNILNGGEDNISELNLQPGDKICYVSMVSAYNQNVSENTFRYSDSNCFRFAKKPKVQVWGGDVITDKKVITSISRYKSGSVTKLYGSWGEYGIIANGNAESASGSGLSSSFNGRSGVNSRDYNKLTFANTPKYGNFSSTSSVPDNFTLPSIGGARGNISGNVDVNSLATGEYNAGNVTLTGSKLSVGKSIVIKSSGVVRISGDLLYTDTNDVRQLPQLIIYAKNIIIEPSVGEVNAWLITQKDGYVSTCGAVISARDWLNGVSESSCGKQQLKINGPIKTGRLFLRRTYGGKHASSAKNDPNMHPGTPAEIINLRADTYIWAYNNYRNTSAISTMNVRELPPRY